MIKMKSKYVTEFARANRNEILCSGFIELKNIFQVEWRMLDSRLSWAIEEI